MESTFDLKKFLIENKLTTNSRTLQKQNSIADSNGIRWNYPDVGAEDYYYEPTEGGYFISLPITGIDQEGNTVEGLYNTEVPELSQEVLDDLDIDPSKIEYTTDQE